jgi:two-component system, NarL family, nitrate/nitrite response regulator NarL
VVTQQLQIRVFVAAHVPIYRDGVTRALDGRPEFRVVGAAGEAGEVLPQIRRLEPDVAVVDADMPGFDAVQLLRTIGRESPATRVVVISAESESPSARRAADSGLAAYVATTAEARLVCDAVAAAARGETPPLAETPAGEEKRPLLSRREREILRLAADGRRAAEIGRDLHVSEATVKTHLQHAYRKLGVSDRAAAVAESLRRGLID